MNFIKLIFIIFIINSLNGQAISTPKTIKPLIQVDNVNSESRVSFIGLEGDGLYQTAKLYDINKNNILMPLESRFNVQACVQEGCSSYFSGGHYGDITGEGSPEIILLITNPSYGTQVLVWTTQENGQYTMLDKPYLINNKQSASEAVSSFLEPVYPDKDLELVVSIGSPDRKVVILDYVGEITSKTIAEDFLENTVGPLVLQLEDFNNDNLKDIYILNNGRPKQSKLYLSPDHRDQKTETNKEKQLLKDIVFFQNKEQLIRIDLLKNNQLFVESWEKKFNLNIENPVKLLKIEENEIFVLNDRGNIAKYLINSNEKTLTQTGVIKNQFKETGYNKIEFLILKNSEILLSHNKNSEIILQSLTQEKNRLSEQKNVNTTITENVLETTRKNKADTDSVAGETIKKEKTQSPKAPQADKAPQQEKRLIQLEPKETTIIKLDQDTIFVNAGEPTTIKISFNPEFEFLDLEEKIKPTNMTLDVASLSFLWTPQIKDAGYNNLNYLMSYNKNTSLTKVEENGKFKLKKNLEKTQTEHGYVIFVNSPPEIKIDKKNYKIQENKELIVPIYISDINADQSLSLDFKPSSLQNAFIEDRKFYWTPNKTDYGKNNIEFIVSDGQALSFANIGVVVDTAKVVVDNKESFIATVNREFIHRLAVTPQTKLEVLKSPENLRISRDGTVHWIPTSPEIGNHLVQIEVQEKEKTMLYQMTIFVNAEPVISYRPDLIEYVNLNENFTFICRSFDQNIDQPLYWNLSGPEGMLLKGSEIQWTANQPDYVLYALSLTDKIDTVQFNGALYVNDVPKIISEPPKYIKLGDSIEYQVAIKDANKKSAFNMQEKNDHIYYLKTAPSEMTLNQEGLLQWTPGSDDIGPHQVELTVTDGLSPAEQVFTLFVNDQPTITSVNNLKIQLGDTLHHFVQAQDANPLSRLTYGINSDIDTMTLNGKTGEIFWAPKEKDLGTHQIEVSVSDGFDLSKDIQTINIIVYKNPEFKFLSLPEAYAGNEYIYTLKAHDMFLKTMPEKDIFIDIQKTTIEEIKLDPLNYNLQIFPSYEEVGEQAILLSLSDSFNNSIEKEFILKVLTSPCETSDTVYVNNEEVVSRLQKIDKSIVYASKKEKLNIGNAATEVDTIYITKYDTTITNITDSVFVTLEEKLKTPIKELSKREKRKLERQAKRSARQAKKYAQRTKNLDQIVSQKEKETQKEEERKKKKASPPVVKTEHKKINIINKETVVVEQVLAKKEPKEKETPKPLKPEESMQKIKFSAANVPVFNDKIMGIKTTDENQFNKHLFAPPPDIVQSSIKTTLHKPEDMLWYK